MSDFRLNSRSVFLTYPKCPLAPSCILESLQANAKYGSLMKEWWISQEEHADGDLHIHAYIKFSEKLDLRCNRSFDVTCGDTSITYHPNIQSPKQAKAVIAYVCKGGVFIHNQIFDWSTAKNFVDRKRDWDSWLSHLSSNCVEPLPPLFKVGNLTFNLSADVKCRNHWIVGAPDCGKTYTFEKVFQKFKVWWVPAGSDFPYEGYTNEQVCIYDDHFPKFMELANVLNTPLSEGRQVYGKSRFTRTYWPKNVVRIIVVLANHLPDYGSHQRAFSARFTVTMWDDFVTEDLKLE